MSRGTHSYTSRLASESYISPPSSSLLRHPLQRMTALAVQSNKTLHVPSMAIEHMLEAHTRAISDINWSPFHPEVLASCSIDSWMWIWDLRMSGNGAQRPAQGYSAWNASMSQVKWNRATPHCIAASCDNKVLIWDDRYGSLPLATLEAHHTKIYGIDWNSSTERGRNELITCSLDGTIKVWDLDTELSHAAMSQRICHVEPMATFETAQPVWRARHTPFGRGMMSVAQRGDTMPSLWSADKYDAPVHRFEGHSDVVREFLFRKHGQVSDAGDERDFQLVTWSKDQTLRLWPLEPPVLSKVGHKKHERESASIIDVSDVETQSMDEERGPAGLHLRYKHNGRIPLGADAVQWMARVHVGSVHNDTGALAAAVTGSSDSVAAAAAAMNHYALPAEILRASCAFPSAFEAIDIARRRLTIAMLGPWHARGHGTLTLLRVVFTFPVTYPQDMPVIKVEKNTHISAKKRSELHRGLVKMIAMCGAKRALCLEPCLQYLNSGAGSMPTDQAESRLEEGLAPKLSESLAAPAVSLCPFAEANSTFAQSHRSIIDAISWLVQHFDDDGLHLEDLGVTDLSSRLESNHDVCILQSHVL